MKKAFFSIFPFVGMFALPQNPNPIAGNIEFNSFPNELIIRASDRSIINWDEFNISISEKVSFLLPDISSSVLNRVTGNQPSTILGELQSNGKLILINPTGIIFGVNSKIDTNSFIATTLNLSDIDFQKGNLHFASDDAGEIVNLGTLTGHAELYLIAPKIEQNGVCLSDRGNVTLASCHEAIVNGPDGKIRLIPKTLAKLQEEGIHCGGTIQAIEARLISDGSLSGFAINLDGIIDAEIVDINASKIEFSPRAIVDTSLDQGGGICAVYGTESIVMASDALINASSKQNGNGGKVRLFSEGITQFEGRIFAEGGAQNGDGGFVEVSGNHLAFQGKVSTKAPFGKTGTLLLDPADIAITNGVTANATSNIVLGTDTWTPNNGTPCYPGPGHAVLNFNDLITALGANNVVIETVGTVGACPGNIFFEDTAVVTYSEANSLTLSAANDIHFFSSVINNGTGPIFITNARDVNLIASDTSIELTTNGGGAISISGVTRDLNVTGGALMNNYARIYSVDAPLNISVGNNINVTGGSANNASARLQASNGTLTISNAATISVSGGSVSSAGSDIIASSGGDALITCQAMMIDTTASGASATVSADNDMTLNVTAGDLQVLADSGGFAVVNASFELNATVSNNITIAGTNGGYAAIFGDRESATIEATNGSITMNGLTQMYSGNQPNANLLVIAGDSIFANGTASFDIFSATGTITLVVDNLFPSAPGLGAGQFVLGPTASINAGGNQIQVFTALASQNTISGTLNGASFPLGANNEQFGIYYPSPFFVSDYVIFYKTATLTGSEEELFVALLQPEFDDFAEVFRDLHPYSEYIYGSIRFNESYENPESLFGLQTMPDEGFRLRKKSTMRDWFELVYDPAKF